MLMLPEMQRISIFAFLMLQAFHLSVANSSLLDATSPSPSPIEAQITLTPLLTPDVRAPTTTTTLASSNAPATTTITTTGTVTTIEAEAEAEAATVDTAATAMESKRITQHNNGFYGTAIESDAIATTMLPEIAPHTVTSKSAPDVAALVTDQGKTTTSSDGNDVKTQIKNIETNPNIHTMDPLSSSSSSATTTTTTTTTIHSTELEMSTEMPAFEETAVGGKTDKVVELETSSTTDTPSATQSSHSHVEVEGKLKNGLYRIKLAEIVTDEFAGLPAEANTEQTLADSTNQKPNLKFVATAGKVNIADLYPMKKEDFDPIIRDSNTKLLKERTVFKKIADVAEYRQNLLPNEVEIEEQHQNPQQQQQQQQHSSFGSDTRKPRPQHLPTLEMTLINRDSDSGSDSDDRDSLSDFTGKLLAEQDGIITEIEQKFRLSEFVPTERTVKTTSTASIKSTDDDENVSGTTTTKMPTAKPIKSINHQFFKNAKNGSGMKASGGGSPPTHDFIDRRVKKSFAFPMHRTASDVVSAPHVDFANTKFTGGSIVNPNGSPAAFGKTFPHDSSTNGGSNATTGDIVVTGAAHPEFSTTKFYNSKELYNEMVMHNRQKQLQYQDRQNSNSGGADTGNTMTEVITTAVGQTHGVDSGFSSTTVLPGAASRFATLKKDFFASKAPLSTTTTTSSSSFSSSSLPLSSTPKEAGATIKQVTLSATTTTAKPETTAKANRVALKLNQYQQKNLLLKTPAPEATAKISTTTTAITTSGMSSVIAQTQAQIATNSPSSSAPVSLVTATSSLGTSSIFSLRRSIPTTTTTTTTITTTTIDNTSSVPITTILASAPTTTPQLHATNPTKSASKPIARPRILSRLQEKINSLECEIQNVPQDSHLWRGNETHELLLPIVTPAHCADKQQGQQQQQQQQQEQEQQQQQDLEHQQAEQLQRDCSTTPVSVSWDGEAEIQSGDILIVEINDASLLSDKNNTNSAHNTQVYQVTRSGHEHCDVTEGILLDITPLVVDGRKLVTLYDKDLTEGVNLLIVVSEFWGAQCVRLKVTTKTDNCGENADCSGKGVCYSNPAMEEYECQCCGGFAGPHCEEIDACTPSPCTNNGICVDLSQGHEGNSYQCLCPYGYTGKNCQYESDPCNPAECMNGGSCVGNSTHFRCDCTPGFTGPLCQHSLNECESSPCLHGICVDQEDGFRCFCQPGFAGELCNFEYNECESNPCQNGGECIDHIGSYECRCTKGYTGNRCQIKVDFCANKPCPEGHRCIDHGNDFSCECPGGRNGPDCNQMARTQCTDSMNPCTHGGTCWSSGDSFYCACRPGYTGTMCEDEFVVETVVSSSEFIVDDTSTRNFNDKTFGSSVVLKSPIELHNAYFAAGVLAAAFFIVAVVVTICHCKVNQTYRKFSTRTTSFIPIIGFGRRPKPQNKLNKHWLSGKGLGSGNSLRSSASSGASSARNHLSSNGGGGGGTALHHSQQHTNVGQLHERPFQRHLAMNLENDMYYTVDFSENSQHSPLIQ